VVRIDEGHYLSMYEKCSKDDIMALYREMIYECKIDQTNIICTIDGTVFREMKTGNWKKIENKKNHNKGYNVILINKKQYTRAKLILYAQHKIKLETKNVNIYHKNGDRLDCAMENLTMDVPCLGNL
jgi:hypothetical protein